MCCIRIIFKYKYKNMLFIIEWGTSFLLFFCKHIIIRIIYSISIQCWRRMIIKTTSIPLMILLQDLLCFSMGVLLHYRLKNSIHKIRVSLPVSPSASTSEPQNYILNNPDQCLVTMVNNQETKTSNNIW